MFSLLFEGAWDLPGFLVLPLFENDNPIAWHLKYDKLFKNFICLKNSFALSFPTVYGLWLYVPTFIVKLAVFGQQVRAKMKLVSIWARKYSFVN